MRCTRVRSMGCALSCTLVCLACDRGAEPVSPPPGSASAEPGHATAPGASARPSSESRNGVRAPSPPPRPEPPKAPPPPLASPTQELPAPLPRDRGFHRGVSLGMFVSSDDRRERAQLYGRFLDEIVEVGATDLQLVVRWVQADVRATEVEPASGISTDDALLRWVMRQARKRGLRVFLMPILHLQHRGKGEWRGKLAPDDWDAWWQSYTRFVLHYARLSQRARVHLFAVGSELVSTESQDERWRTLIAQVRGVYSGQLTYSANWDHFEPVRFWDALDLAGITGYQALSRQPQPDERALQRGFWGLQHRIAAWTEATGQRFVFTEIGYPSQPGGAARPWDYRDRGKPDLQLQLRCYRALYRAFQDSRRLAGLYVWNWFGQGGAQDTGYTPRGKPSAEVLRHWYRGSLAARP